jgi:hypothetical protein
VSIAEVVQAAKLMVTAPVSCHGSPGISCNGQLRHPARACWTWSCRASYVQLKNSTDTKVPRATLLNAITGAEKGEAYWMNCQHYYKGMSSACRSSIPYIVHTFLTP